jgi:hypothetical protein
VRVIPRILPAAATPLVGATVSTLLVLIGNDQIIWPVSSSSVTSRRRDQPSVSGVRDVKRVAGVVDSDLLSAFEPVITAAEAPLFAQERASRALDALDDEILQVQAPAT